MHSSSFPGSDLVDTEDCGMWGACCMKNLRNCMLAASTNIRLIIYYHHCLKLSTFTFQFAKVSLRSNNIAGADRKC